MMRYLRPAIPFLALLIAGCAAPRPTGHGLPIDPASKRPIPKWRITAERPGVAYERFMVIGDFGTGKAGQREVAAAMAKQARSDGLDFILSTGDNFYDEGVKSADDPQWKTKFEEVYADPALRVPWYPILGNHDHRGNAQAQINYGKRNTNWKMPALYYTFTRTLADGTSVQFFALDTYSILKEDPGVAAQMEWLDQELGESDARWKIVYGHYPLYSSSNRASCRYYDEMIARLEPLFLKHDVDLYLAGHDHHLEMLRPIKGVHYVISGGGSGTDRAYEIEWTDQAYYAATLGGYVLARISKDELVLEFVRPDARTQYAHTLRK